MDVEDGVLEFFHEELSIVTTWKLRHVPLEMDDILQEYADGGELVDAIAAYGEKFQLDVTRIHWANYYPWRRDSAIRRWLFLQSFLQTKKTLSTRMFADSAKAGRWLYD
ncbi:DUF1493 family protein [Erwinia aphidicola]|uniref:DUF1493 family protein n=1 Tax=Erwinia aphidicola TaxID=68334 RepID=UPI001745FC2A|nr:DUF1493 family protein [Erwinia aphidicola]MBD1376182.1 DUF1493 family protein [Erwinia aphidicola]